MLKVQLASGLSTTVKKLITINLLLSYSKLLIKEEKKLNAASGQSSLQVDC